MDISQNTQLEELYCQFNLLTNLNLNQNTNLIELNCAYNSLTNLNILQNTNLITLYCYNNQLTQLDLSQNIALANLTCAANQLTQLNLSQNQNLLNVNCETNQLIMLDIRNGNNLNIEEFIAVNNPNLTCIFVDDSNYSENNSNWIKDPTSHYVETQAECDALAGIDDFLLHQIKIYPNPVKEILNINSEFRIQDSELTLTTILGKKVYRIPISGQEIEIDLSHFTPGIYFLTIQNQKKQSLTTKIIKL